MEHKKHWMKYIDTLGVDNELAQTYYNLRKAFQREGWTEEDLVRPPYYPTDIMRNFQKFSGLRNEIFSEIKSFFGDVDHNEFSDSSPVYCFFFYRHFLKVFLSRLFLVYP